MSKKITQKIKELLTPEDLKVFESAVDVMVDEKALSKAQSIITLKEEELKSKYETLAEEYVQKEISERLTVEKVKLVESYDAKMNLLEEKVIAKLDSFLDHVIAEQVSDEMLEKIAINETLTPVVEGIRNVFTQNHLKVNSKAKANIDALKSELTEAKAELNESIEKQMKMQSQLEQSAVFLMISEKTNGFAKTERAKVMEMFKDKDFEEVQKNIDGFVSVLKESSSVKTQLKTNTLKPTKSVKAKVNSINESTVVSALSQKEPIKQPVAREEVTVEDIANNYL